MKILKSKKALSPVVASIILIAVTVAVSIAVAAWMGALTFSFMGSSTISITKVEFAATNMTYNGNITITVKNTGTKQVTIAAIEVNSESASSFSGTLTLNPGDVDETINIELVTEWVAGNSYQIDLYDTSGTGVGSTQKTAS